jgi:hypothetical protein
VAKNDQAEGDGRVADGGFEVDGPVVFVAVLLGAGEQSGRAVGGNEAPDGRMAGGGGFAAEHVHRIIGEIVRGSVLSRWREKQEVAIVGDALVIAVDGLEAVTQEIGAGFDGLIAEVLDGDVEVNGADEFSVDHSSIVDAEGVAGLRGGGDGGARPDFAIGSVAGAGDRSTDGREYVANCGGDLGGNGDGAGGGLVVLREGGGCEAKCDSESGSEYVATRPTNHCESPV